MTEDDLFEVREPFETVLPDGRPFVAYPGRLFRSDDWLVVTRPGLFKPPRVESSGYVADKRGRARPAGDD
jgi:hypothetical protein